MIVPRLTNDLYHYTRADVAIYNILDQGALRISPYEFTNDPQESRQKLPGLSGPSGDDASVGDEAGAIWRQADWWLRRYVKVACFTQDFELPDHALDEDALRGWAHPALWAHYGAGHGGVCLRFDRDKLVERFHAQMCSRGQCFHGAVEYPTQRFLGAPSVLDVDQVREFGTDAVVSFYIEKYHRELFFTKHHDWANEAEFRLILNEPSLLPVYLNIEGCLTGVLLGDTFPAPMLDTVYHLLSRSPGVELVQLRFHNGKIHRLPAMPAPEERPVSGRRAGSLADRFQELRSLELQREQAKARGAKLAAGIVERLAHRIAEVQSACADWLNVEAMAYPRPRAIPSGQYGRKPGVPGEVVEFQSGWMCVVENLPKYSCTLVIALAIQLLETGTVRFHGAITLETWLPSGNQMSELWRGSRESAIDNAATMAEALIEEMDAQMESVRRKFDLCRSG